jgi:hypothetical protein
MADSPDLVLGLNAVILALTDEEPRVLALRQAEGAPLEGGPAPDDMGSNRLLDTLPTGPLDPSGDRTLELAVRRWVRPWPVWNSATWSSSTPSAIDSVIRVGWRGDRE